VTSRQCAKRRVVLVAADRETGLRRIFGPYSTRSLEPETLVARLVPKRDEAVQFYFAKYHANGVPRGPVRMMHRGCRDPRPYDAAMIGTAITSQPERTGPDWFGKVATRPSTRRSPATHRPSARRPSRPYQPRAGALVGAGWASAASWRRA